MDSHFLKSVIGIDMESTQLIFCHNCCKIINTGNVPRIHTSNGLEVETIPEELDLTDLKQQLIARNLIFEKIKKNFLYQECILE